MKIAFVTTMMTSKLLANLFLFAEEHDLKEKHDYFNVANIQVMLEFCASNPNFWRQYMAPNPPDYALSERQLLECERIDPYMSYKVYSSMVNRFHAETGKYDRCLFNHNFRRVSTFIFAINFEVSFISPT